MRNDRAVDVKRWLLAAEAAIGTQSKSRNDGRFAARKWGIGSSLDSECANDRFRGGNRTTRRAIPRIAPNDRYRRFLTDTNLTGIECFSSTAKTSRPLVPSLRRPPILARASDINR
jgi:hypothetical protein